MSGLLAPIRASVADLDVALRALAERVTLLEGMLLDLRETVRALSAEVWARVPSRDADAQTPPRGWEEVGWRVAAMRRDVDALLRWRATVEGGGRGG